MFTPAEKTGIAILVIFAATMIAMGFAMSADLPIAVIRMHRDKGTAPKYVSPFFIGKPLSEPERQPPIFGEPFKGEK